MKPDSLESWFLDIYLGVLTVVGCAVIAAWLVGAPEQYEMRVCYKLYTPTPVVQP